MPPVAPPLPTVLVLASGKGERFRASGGRVHKLQADLCGRSVLDRTLDAVRASGLPWHLEDAGHPGMGDSVAAAVRATRHAPGWLMLPADLPLIAAATLVSVARTLMAGTAMAVLPWVGGRRAHPVGFAGPLGQELSSLEGKEGARRIISRLDAMKSVANVQLDDVGAVTDIDTIEDLQRAADLLHGRGTAPAA
ncbi:nucleotidyltransferase family protein [Xylophilus ampelinus]|uniref:Molybdenum cofactor cytidylyltransferase n=1 Tax=Xylophilus ampelinus TaxID=54067 RepID=A0A318SHK5_9BURK|nr:NTP transferase domain-containing protein [Xylophilus ampelinus]MCS4508675.1 NTP transferase domain-containing protein [Xylophilus ampelinus]PYE74310.1 molybdenum cofactor cytidylyltransferase [Xylophilus ampelinus]